MLDCHNCILYKKFWTGSKGPGFVVSLSHWIMGLGLFCCQWGCIKQVTFECDNSFKFSGKEHRFCYYVGGLEDSATGILGEISKPLSWGLPSEKICEKLKKKDGQICQLRYGKILFQST